MMQFIHRLLVVFLFAEGAANVNISSSEISHGKRRRTKTEITNDGISNAVYEYITNGATTEYGPIEDWDVSAVNSFKGLFFNAEGFNGDLSRWDMSNAIDTSGMFYFAVEFDSDLSAWDVSKVMIMDSMFENAKRFNANLSAWDVSNVRGMKKMFYDAGRFNSDISSWDTSRVFDMGSMFMNAYSFSSNLTKWDIGGAKHTVDYNMDFTYNGMSASMFLDDDWGGSTMNVLHPLISVFTILVLLLP